ncbi:MAG: hypothetical protein ACP6IY_17240 [Promethearchaeia archaeon]
MIKIADEFANFLAEARKAPLEEKLNAFGDIVENIMNIVLKIPDLVDQTLANLIQKINGMESRLNSLANEINAIKARGGAPAGPSPGGPAGGPGAPPPPPGAPPGPPPPPGGPPGGPGSGPSRPASPATLRGAIMSELKQLFAKRKQG